jgi:hypothetical protein
LLAIYMAQSSFGIWVKIESAATPTGNQMNLFEFYPDTSDVKPLPTGDSQNKFWSSHDCSITILINKTYQGNKINKFHSYLPPSYNSWCAE